MVTLHLSEDIHSLEGASLLPATPKDVDLWLQGNPIGAEGLDWLTPAVAACPTLQTLQLAHIGLDVAAVQEIAAFASMLTAHEGMAKVDLFGNLIGEAHSIWPLKSNKLWFNVPSNFSQHLLAGDAAAQELLAALQARPKLVLLLLTSHIRRPLMKQIVTELAAHVAANKRKRSAKKKAK